MLINAQCRTHVSYAVERDASRLMQGDFGGDDVDLAMDGECAEICRMIELSGMIGLDCDLLQVA